METLLPVTWSNNNIFYNIQKTVSELEALPKNKILSNRINNSIKKS